MNIAKPSTTTSRPLCIRRKASWHSLDVDVTRSDTRLSTSVYRKPTNTDYYIPFLSYHHQRTITGELRCMRERATISVIILQTARTQSSVKFLRS